MDSRPSSPQPIPSRVSKDKITKSAPTGFSSSTAGPGLSSTGERSVIEENNVFERVPIPSKSSFQSNLSALGTILESSKPPPTDAASWMKASFGAGRKSLPTSDSSQVTSEPAILDTDSAVSPVEIPESEKWDSVDPAHEVGTASDSSVTNQTHYTLPRVSRQAPKHQFARRSFSTKATNSPATILVNKRVSEAGSSKQSISPVTSESFSSLGMSPAISFLSSFTEQAYTSRKFSNEITILANKDKDALLSGIYGPGDTMGEYTLIREIGCGSFSRVYEASSNDPQNPLVAIKIIHSDSNLSFDKLALQKESFLWSKLSHPNLLRMFESFDTDDAVLVVTELAPGGHLLDYVLKEGRPGLSESVTRSLFKQLVSAVFYLHTVAGIVHRDIKLENILLDESKQNIKLSDFGLSESISDSFWDNFEESREGAARLNTSSGHVRSISVQGGPPNIAISYDSRTFAPGSLHYCAPEILKQSKTSKLSSDIWSMGCVLHALLIGSLPFNDSYLPRLQMSIINGRWDPSRLEKAQLSSNCINLIMGMLQLKVEERYSISEVMHHPWLQS
jgi:serine/threonine protein kinase